MSFGSTKYTVLTHLVSLGLLYRTNQNISLVPGKFVSLFPGWNSFWFCCKVLHVLYVMRVMQH